VQNVRQTVSEQTKLSTDFRGFEGFSNIPIRYAEHTAFSLCGVISYIAVQSKNLKGFAFAKG